MKQVFTFMFIAMTLSASSQIYQVERQVITKEQLNAQKNVLDSLSKLYKKKVFGYQRTLTIRDLVKETFIIFYTVGKETEDSVVWARELVLAPKIAPKSVHEGILPLGASSVFYNSTYIGFIKDGYFTRVTPDDGILFLTMSKDVRKFIVNQDAINKYLLEIYGGYYRGIVN